MNSFSPSQELLQQDVATLAKARQLEARAMRSAALKEYYFPPVNAWYDRACIWLNWAIAAGLLLAIAPNFFNWNGLWRVPLCFTAALLIADTMSAVFHKFLDSYASEKNPWWGSSARAFRIHHEFPHNLNETTYVHNVSAFATFTLLLYGIFGALLWVGLSANGSLVGWFMVALFANGTEIHKQSHRPHPVFWVGWLQKAGFFLRRGRHLRHHRHHFNSDYGIINGWSSFFLPLAFWECVDRFIWKQFKILPRNWVQVPESLPQDFVEDMAGRPEMAIYAPVVRN